MTFDVLGIENPLVDLMAQVPDEFLARMKVEKNRMFLVDQDRHRELLEALLRTPIHAEPGGSCANTMQGIAQLGGRTAYCGKVGADEYGRVFAPVCRQVAAEYGHTDVEVLINKDGRRHGC